MRVLILLLIVVSIFLPPTYAQSTETPVNQFRLTGKGIYRIHWLPDSSALLVIPFEEGLLMAKPDGAVVTRRPDLTSIQSVAFSPDGLTLALGGRDEIILTDTSLNTREVIKAPGAADIYLYGFSRDGRILYGGGDRWVKVDMAQKKAAIGTKSYRGHYGGMLLPDGSGIIAQQGTAVGRISLDGKLLKRFNRESSHMESVSRNGKWVVTSYGDTRFWSIADATGAPFAYSELKSAAIHPSKPYFAAARNFQSKDDAIVLFDQNGKLMRIVEAFGKEIKNACPRGDCHIWALEFSPDGRQLAAGFADGWVRIYDTSYLEYLQPDLPPVTRLAGSSVLPPDMMKSEPKAALRTVGRSPDGIQLAAAWENGLVVVWNNGKESGRWKLAEQPVSLTWAGSAWWLLALSGKTGLLAANGEWQPIKVDTGAFATSICTLPGEGGELAAAGEAGIHILNNKNLSVRDLNEDPPGIIFKIACGREFIAAACEDRKLRLYKPDGGKPKEFAVPSQRALWHVAISNDGRIAASDSGGGIFVWLPDGKLQASRYIDGAILDLAWDGGDILIATGAITPVRISLRKQ